MIDLESIQHKLSSDYSLTICFSRRFPYIDGNMQFFFQELFSDIDKNSGEKFEGMFLVKIASKGTSLRKKFLLI